MGPGGVRRLWSVPLTLRSRERHPLCIAQAVPAGSVWALNQQVWWDAVLACPQLAVLRTDRLATVLAVARVLRDCADWGTRVSRPTHAELARRAGCSTRTVRRVRALLEAAGLVGIVTAGRTLDLVEPEAGPLAQAYVLSVPQALLAHLRPGQPAVDVDSGDQDDVDQEPGPGMATSDPALTSTAPPVDEHGHPSQPTFGGLDQETPTRVRDDASERARCARGAQPRLEDLGREIIWPVGAWPATRTERQLAATEAWRIDPVLRRVSVAHVAALCREWHLAGWTIADIRHALVQRPDDHPDGPAWPHSLVAADVRHVPGWVRHRLSAWRTDPGDPASPPARSRSQRVAAAATAAAAAHAAQLATDTAARAAAVAAATVTGWTAAKADAAARAATARAAAAHARHQPPTLPQDAPTPAAPPAPGPRAAEPAPRAPTPPPPAARAALRPAAASADPRIAALRTAIRTGRRPRI